MRALIVASLKVSVMSPAVQAPEEIVEMAALAARGDPGVIETVIESLGAPIYLTDAEGWITYYNRACIDFAGQAPVLGEARWCVTWKLYTEDGTFLPHDACPMAVAIREQRPVRGAVALAERPDGTRVMFTPYPTPLYDEDGGFAGAVNLLIDVTDGRQAGALRAQAAHCRRLAYAMSDPQAIDTLQAMAAEYDAKAAALAGAAVPD
jgi:PAS domain-containing protein